MMEQMFTTAEMSAILKVSPRTMERWRRESRGPRYIVVEGQIRYLQSDVDEYLATPRKVREGA